MFLKIQDLNAKKILTTNKKKLKKELKKNKQSLKKTH